MPQCVGNIVILLEMQTRNLEKKGRSYHTKENEVYFHPLSSIATSDVLQRIHRSLFLSETAYGNISEV